MTQPINSFLINDDLFLEISIYFLRIFDDIKAIINVIVLYSKTKINLYINIKQTRNEYVLKTRFSNNFVL